MRNLGDSVEGIGNRKKDKSLRDKELGKCKIFFNFLGFFISLSISRKWIGWGRDRDRYRDRKKEKYFDAD
jgi:hypothetical protein